MRKLILSSIVGATTAFAVTGCSNSPGSPSISFGAPVAVGPATGTSLKFKAQPVTLSITNVVRTGPATTTYTVEVATDQAFGTKVLTTTVPEASGSTTTSVTLSSLPASAGNVTYYWHWFATVDGVASSPTATQNFVVQQQIVVSAPTPSTPAAGVVLTEVRPPLVTANAARQGAVGPITYSFQISKNSAFTDVIASATVPEQNGGQTSWTPPLDLPGGTLFWRVRANDPANTETSSFSNVTSFVVDPFNPHKAIFLNNPSDVADWEQTAKITSIDFNDDALIVEFDRRTGPGSWPEAGFGSDGGIQYTLGLCYNISSQWYCSAPIQFWAGRDLEAAGSPSRIQDLWYYDPARWGPMAGHQPENGERVAVWVGQGNLRGSGNTYRERSNFVVVPFGQSYRAN